MLAKARQGLVEAIVVVFLFYVLSNSGKRLPQRKRYLGCNGSSGKIKRARKLRERYPRGSNKCDERHRPEILTAPPKSESVVLDPRRINRPRRR